MARHRANGRTPLSGASLPALSTPRSASLRGGLPHLEHRRNTGLTSRMYLVMVAGRQHFPHSPINLVFSTLFGNSPVDFPFVDDRERLLSLPVCS
jgi:hypothetical protein